jgi:hypothetical protein
MSNQNNTPPPPKGELMFQMQVMTKMMERMNFMIGNMCDRLEKEKKRRLRVSNIYDHNAFMMLDKERETRLEKIYKETNKKHEEWRASVQHQKDKNKIGQEKYKRKWKARHAYLK